MKKTTKILSVLLAVLLLVLTVPVTTATASNGTDPSYTKNKVVSVLFDNSGSMQGEKWNTARYALQTLMTTLGKNDTLRVVPMNKTSGAVNKDGEYVEVDLAAEDRNKEIERIFLTVGATFLSAATPTGKTPSETIGVALQELIDMGMKTTAETGADEISKNDYFLLVLTDGAFNPKGVPGEEIKDPAVLFDGYFKDDLSKYASFQSIYIGFSDEALDLSAYSASSANFSAYKAKDSAAIGGVMKQVANRITGRYTLENFTVNGSTVTIPLDGVGFALRSVTVMATQTNARFSSAKYGTETLTPSQNVSFQPPAGMAGKGGFTAILSRSAGTFSGGTITLTLDEAIEKSSVSILLEPALALSPIVECEKDGSWIEVDAAYINSNLTKKNKIRLSYIITEQGTGNTVDLDAIFGTTVARVSYNTKTYDVGEAFSLATGNHEIGLSVSVMDGAYSLYASFPCVVLDNPTSFRIEDGGTVTSGNNYTTTFKVFDDGNLITSLSALNAYSPSVTATREDGSTIPVSVIKRDDGTFAATLALDGEAYGTFKLRATVRSAEGNPRTLDVAVGYYPSGLVITPDKTELSKTLFGIIDNTEGISFRLTAPDAATGNDIEIPFGLSQITYTVTAGTVDLTAAASVSGNVLTIVPTAELLGALAGSVGEHALKVKVVFNKGSAVETAEGSAKLALTDTVYEIVPLEKTPAPINRFSLSKNEGSIYFRVLRDGVSLSEEELAALLADGSLTVNANPAGGLLDFINAIGPLASEQTVETVDGAPAIRARICSCQGGFLPFILTAMFVSGDRVEMTASYRGVEAMKAAPLANASIFQYVIRILIYLYIIQLIIVAVTFKDQTKVKRVPQGALVRLSLSAKEGRHKAVETVRIIKVISLKEHLMLGRLIPFVGLLPRFRQKDVPTTVGTLLYTETGLRMRSTRACVEAEIRTRDGNNPIVPKVRQKFANIKPKGGITLRYEPAELNNMWVEATDQTTEAAKLSRLGTMSGPILNDNLYVFIEKSLYEKR
ncbi:MAG: VWA domain-containing protein [Clostridia bacterium]|nr:VWA domain-containing protein [Clostridia bacterium]